MFKDKLEKERAFSKESKAKDVAALSQVKQAKLEDVMKIDLIVDKSKDEIAEIWREYHQTKDCVSGILTAEQFDKMFERGSKYPTFLLPLPRNKGYEFIVLQFHGNDIHLTPLLWYQTHKENAPECLTLVHYTDLRESKGIVLMKGEYDVKTINVQEAQCLVNELQLYYCHDDPERLKLLESFTKQPDNFKHMSLVQQLENISLGSVINKPPEKQQQFNK